MCSKHVIRHMAAGSSELLSVCPYLIPCNSSGTLYEGYIQVHEEEFHIQLILPAPNDVKNIRVRGNWKLHQLLEKCQATIRQRLLQCSSVIEFLQELQTIVEKEIKLEKPDVKETLYPPSYYESLISQLELCGWDKVSNLSSDLSQIDFTIDDSDDRQHTLHIKLPKEFPRGHIAVTADLPVQFAPQWSKDNAFLDILSQFRMQVEVFQHFWNLMDDLDSELWVLEPEKPTRKDVMRRIAVQRTTSMQIIVDPLNPNSIPECRFFGPDSSVAPLQEAFNKNVDYWSDKRTIVENLRSVLQIEFPSATSSKKDEFSIECGICYSYRINDDCFPDVTCEGPNCGQLFHQVCLHEWLRTLPNTRQSFNTLFGDCPHCGTNIICKIP